MLDRYDLFGCIDFQTGTYAITVPLLRRRNSNYTYVPKTDNHFIVLDFYEIPDIAYDVKSVDSVDERQVSIGEKSPVPIVQDGDVFIVDPDWNEADIRSKMPRLRNEAIKAFLSLRSRMAQTAPVQTGEADITEAVDDLLSQPVRSRYWISKFSALVRSTFERGDPSQELISKFESGRLRWLDRFSAKSSLKLVQGMLEVPQLKLQPESVNRVMLQRFERMLLTKGIHISRTELRAYAVMFPNGIFDAIKQETGGQFEFWSRRNAISEHVVDQTHELVYPADSTQTRIHEPSRWSVGELSSLLMFFDVVARSDTALDNSRQMFIPLFNKCLEQVQQFLGDRYQLSNAVFRPRDAPSWLLSEMFRALDMRVVQVPPSSERWLETLRGITELHRKLLAVSKIARPNTTGLDDKDIVFEGIDYVLLDAVNQAVATRSLNPLRAILQPTPESVSSEN